MKVKYKNSPIVEAICEFRFKPQDWDLAIPGLVYEKLRTEFPHRKQIKDYLVDLELSANGSRQSSALTSIDRIQFYQKDKKALFQIGKDFLTINVLKPYPTWDTFLDKILKVFRVYRNFAKARVIQRISLKYINHITFDEEVLELADHFNFYPHTCNKLANFSSFVVGVQSFWGNNSGVADVRIYSPAKRTGKPSVRLDINSFTLDPQKVPQDIKGVKSWVDHAHRHIEEIFGAVIKKNLKSKFARVENA